MLSKVKEIVKFARAWSKKKKEGYKWDVPSVVESVIENKLITFSNGGYPSSVIINNPPDYYWREYIINAIDRSRELGIKCVLFVPAFKQKYTLHPLPFLRALDTIYRNEDTNSLGVTVDVSVRNDLIEDLYNKDFRWKLQLDNNFMDLLLQKSKYALDVMDKVQESIDKTGYPILSKNIEYNINSFDLNLALPSYIVQQDKLISVFKAKIDTSTDWNAPTNEVVDAIFYALRMRGYDKELKLVNYAKGSSVLRASLKDSSRFVYEADNIISGTEHKLHKAVQHYKLDNNNLIESFCKGVNEGYTTFYGKGAVF